MPLEETMIAEVHVYLVPLRKTYASAPWLVYIGSRLSYAFADRRAAIEQARFEAGLLRSKTLERVFVSHPNYCCWCGAGHMNGSGHAEGKLFFCGHYQESLCKHLYFKRLRLHHLALQRTGNASDWTTMQETGTD